MSFLQKSSIVFVVFFSFCANSICFSDSPMPGDDFLGEINDLVLANYILSEKKSAELAELFKKAAKRKDLLELREVAVGITWKVEKDQRNMELLFLEIKKLLKADHFGDIHDIRSMDLKKCTDGLERLRKNVMGKTFKLQENKDFTIGDYRKIIKEYSKFFITSKDGVAVYEVWEDIRANIEGAYLFWERQYEGFAQRMEFARGQGESIEAVFNDEELAFIRDFGRLRGFFHLLEGKEL